MLEIIGRKVKREEEKVNPPIPDKIFGIDMSLLLEFVFFAKIKGYKNPSDFIKEIMREDKQNMENKVMIAQIEPSYDDLAFKPKMTWGDFIKWSAEKGFTHIVDETWGRFGMQYVTNHKISIFIDRVICYGCCFKDMRDVEKLCIAKDVPFEKCTTIIENMFDKVEE